MLPDRGGNVNHQIDIGISLIYLACYEGHITVVKLLLDRGVNINLQTTEGLTPLYIATQQGHEDIVKMLQGL